MKPTENLTPDEWARKNRSYPDHSGLPGPRDPGITPYVIPFMRAVHERVHKRVVLCISGQSGKSEALLDIIGQRMDTSPVPTLYVGPTQQFIREQWEPRIEDLIKSTSLSRKAGWGQRSTKSKKTISGVSLRLAHAGSSSQLKSDPFGLALTDEADELMANVKGAGDPIGLIDVRGDTYADFVHAIVSTPSRGVADVVKDEESGLEFWDTPDTATMESTIWSIWQSGTRHHWAWPCPHCGEYFVPRFRCLAWDKPKDDEGRELPSDSMLAQKTAHLICPTNGCVITDDYKADMNAKGVFVAPGQKISPDGEVVGQPKDSWTLSFWVSGLASPFVSWGDRAARYIEAVRSGKQESVQAVINGGFGELYAPGGGEVPEWGEIRALAQAYSKNEIPGGVQVLIASVDVQKSRLVYVVRGWGHRGTSWLVDFGELYGDTAEDAVWDDLADLLTSDIGGMPIRFMMIDAGYRPGKPSIVPVHRVHAFARRFPSRVRACRGSSNAMRKPILTNKIDITIKGREFKKGLTFSTLDTDYFKSWVHERVRWPSDQPGAWYLPEDVTDDYCMQIVSEARVKTPAGKVQWVQRSRENHFLDCESMQAAAAMMLNLFRLRDNGHTELSLPEPEQQPGEEPEPQEFESETGNREFSEPMDEDREVVEEPRKPVRRPKRGSWLEGGSIW